MLENQIKLAPNTVEFIYKYRSKDPDIHFRREQSANNKNALGILKKRLASGEISQLEYDRMKKTFYERFFINSMIKRNNNRLEKILIVVPRSAAYLVLTIIAQKSLTLSNNIIGENHEKNRK